MAGEISGSLLGYLKTYRLAVWVGCRRNPKCRPDWQIIHDGVEKIQVAFSRLPEKHCANNSRVGIDARYDEIMLTERFLQQDKKWFSGSLPWYAKAT